MLREGFAWHSSNPRAQKSLTSLTTFVVLKLDWITFAQQQLLIITDNYGIILKVDKSKVIKSVNHNIYTKFINISLHKLLVILGQVRLSVLN